MTIHLSRAWSVAVDVPLPLEKHCGGTGPGTHGKGAWLKSRMRSLIGFRATVLLFEKLEIKKAKSAIDPKPLGTLTPPEMIAFM